MTDALIGGIVGLLLGVIFEDPLKDMWRAITRFFRRLFVKQKDVQDPYYFSLGSEMTSFVVCDGDGEMTFAPENIETRLTSTKPAFEEDLQELKNEIERIQEENLQNGESHSWNGPLFALEKHMILRTNINEDMKAVFTFTPSDYYTFKAINTNLDKMLPNGQTIKEKYLAHANHKRPIVQIANGFGVALVVVTADGQTILTKRSPESGVRPDELDIGIVEAVHPSQDRHASGQGPDFYKTSIRGAKEELGLTVSEQDIKLLGYGVDEEYYQWNIIGILYCKETSEEIVQNRSRGISGKWELEDLRFVPFKINQILKILKEEKMWSTAKIALYWGLIHDHTRSSVDARVRKVFG